MIHNPLGKYPIAPDDPAAAVFLQSVPEAVMGLAYKASERQAQEETAGRRHKN